jgi:hypothetical protein
MTMAGAAYLDSAMLNSVMRPDAPEPPRMNDLPVTTADDGAPVQEAYGREAKVSGHLLDVSDMIEQKNNHNSGKGGSGGDWAEYTYSVHVLVSFGLGPCDRVKRIYANGKIIYNVDPDVSINATDITGTAFKYYRGSAVNDSYTFDATWDAINKKLTRTSGGPASIHHDPEYGNGVDYVQVIDAGGTGLGTTAPYPASDGPTPDDVYLDVGALATSSGPVRVLMLRNYSTLIGGGLFSTNKYYYYLRLEAPYGGTDLSVITVSSNRLEFITPQPGEYTVASSGKNPDGSTYCVVRKSSSATTPFTSFAPPTVVTLFQDNPQWLPRMMSAAPEFHVGPSSGRVGAWDAPVDTLFEALRDELDYPAYRGLITVRFTNLQLFDFGNTLPQFEAVIEETDDRTVGEFLAWQCAEAGIDPALVDTSAITTPLLGYVVRGAQDVRMKLAPLMLGYEMMSSEHNGVLRFYKRVNAPTATLDASLLAASVPGSSPSRPVRYTDSDDDPPSRYIVKYRDADKEYEIATQLGMRQASADSRTTVMDLSALTMEASDAKALAVHTALLADINRRTVAFSVPLSVADRVYEGVRVTVPLSGRAREVLVIGVDRNHNGVMEVDGHIEGSHILALAPTPEAPATPPGGESSRLGFGTGTRSTGQTVLSVFMDLPPLSDEHSTRTGLYLAVAPEDPGARFLGFTLMRASDELSEEFQPLLTGRSAATMGRATTALGAYSGGAWDETNTVDVELVHGELSSVTELACLNGSNRALIGGELIGYRSAELIGTNQYRLSGLLRGLRGTEGLHVADEAFVDLTRGGIHFVPIETASVGMVWNFRVLSSGQRVTEVESIAVVPMGRTCMPFAPCSLAGARDGSNNLTITWERVTRANVRLLTRQSIPLVEPFERYEVDVIDSAGDVLRTITTYGPSATYTAAQQTADGLTPGDPVRVSVYQVGDIIRRGRPAWGTL